MAGETAFEKVELWLADLATTLTATGQPLEGWVVATNQSRDEALDADNEQVIVIASRSISFSEAADQGQDLVTQIVLLEFISGNAPAGTLRPENLRAAANFHEALSADRTLGGKVQMIEAVDIAPGDTEGKDVNSVSPQYTVSYFVCRDDWFHVIGHGGVAN